MYIAECSALAAALCWSFGGLLSTTPARAFGAIRFNRLRLGIVSLVLFAAVFATGGWRTLGLQSVLVLTMSAMIGIFLGDTLLYATLKRLGPRRTGILFTTNAPMTVIVGYFFLDESLPVTTITGCVLILVGVMMAVFCGRRSSPKHAFEEIQGSLSSGIFLGFSSAFCQAISILIARPIMASGVDAVAASALRVGVAALALNFIFLLQPTRGNPKDTPITRKLMVQTGLSGIVGMALGMTFLLFALAHGPAGLVSTLSATSPVLILPILWIATRERPAPGAWVGAFLAVVGVACIFSP
jgi:drug/metabolite transporter (DMT)-like permease